MDGSLVNKMLTDLFVILYLGLLDVCAGNGIAMPSSNSARFLSPECPWISVYMIITLDSNKYDSCESIYNMIIALDSKNMKP